MHKVWFSILILGAVVLSACTPAATPAAVASATPLPAPSATAPAAQAGTAVVPAGDTMQCTLETILPTPEANRFAPVTEKDWAQGPADAKITLLEYSDFM